MCNNFFSDVQNVAVADFNYDGMLDMLVTMVDNNQTTTNTMNIYLQAEGSTFSKKKTEIFVVRLSTNIDLGKPIRIDEPIDAQPTLIDVNYDVKPDILGMSRGKPVVWLNLQRDVEPSEKLPRSFRGFRMYIYVLCYLILLLYCH
jgi:hypothetical protein